MKAVQVLFDENLLRRLDADAEVRADGQSAVLRRAADEYLRRRRAKRPSEAYRRAYGESRARDWGRVHRLARSRRMARENREAISGCTTFAASDKRRPVLVITRQEVIGLLHTVMVAPIASTLRGAPAKYLLVGTAEGLKHQSAVNLDHVQTVEQRLIRWSAGSVRRASVRSAGRSPDSHRMRRLIAGRFRSMASL